MVNSSGRVGRRDVVPRWVRVTVEHASRCARRGVPEDAEEVAKLSQGVR
jgi:hypothetical protein